MYLHPVFKRHILKSQKLQGWKKVNHATTNEKPYVATPVSEKTDFKSRSISRDREGYSNTFQMYKAKYTTKRKNGRIHN